MSRAEHLYHRIMVGLLFTLLALPFTGHTALCTVVRLE
ncbi:Uncharacterised protein [Pantoea agglomerans]|uniref:Uncharacterized protein n=1 Tax=Enterobacter agglomerans TaxID=549 RepID=A0A379ANT2_ENTAG|nr:Uncharacterised protein [Pantoea agglomerans]